MNLFKYIGFIFLAFESIAQIDIINTGNNSYISPSVIGENILIDATDNYLAKSYDECNNLILLNAPGSPGYSNYLSRIDTSVFYVLSVNFNLFNTKIFKSIDGGYNWILQKDTTGLFTHIKFFDNQEGIAFSTFGKLLRTKNGGNSWIASSSNIPTYVTAVGIFGDSIICLGGADGALVISKDRGNTWPIGGGFPSMGSPHANDFSFLDKDTILGVSSPGFFGAFFTKTFDGGSSWQTVSVPLDRPFGMTSKNFKEGYVVGMKNDSMGMILKTEDLGQTWSSFNTGIKSELSGIHFINDSIALVSGSSGTLFKWNSRQTIFTGIGENYLNNLGLKIFPNPVKDKLNFEFVHGFSNDLKVSISNNIGLTIYSKDNVDLEMGLDVNFLSAGIYILKLKNTLGEKYFKFIKEP